MLAMKRHVGVVGALIAAACLSGPVVAAPAPPAVKGEKGVLVVPMVLWRPEGVRLGNGGVIYTVDIRTTDGAMAVNGNQAWDLAGFPAMAALKVEKVTQKDTGIEIELREDGRAQSIGAVKLRFAPGSDSPGAFHKMFIPERDAPMYLDAAYASLARAMFTGPLATLTPDTTRSLLAYAHTTVGGVRISSTMYKENTYMLVDLGSDTSIYNDLQLNQSGRVSRILNDKLLSNLKAFAKPVEGAPQIYGLKIEFKIPHKSFLDTAAQPSIDTMELYAPAAEIKKFADADTTNQQFIDACIVIVNDNRIQVPLAAASGR